MHEMLISFVNLISSNCAFFFQHKARNPEGLVEIL